LHAFYFDLIALTRRISQYKKNYGSIYVVATCTRRGNNPNVFILKIGSSKSLIAMINITTRNV
ncbi:hypothetical protein, partial [Bacillus thuringiensis]|uniref:hypothetical protein n=1 Tax=Bacillus thuringiensis TaxID=1428 RepID=UPI001C3F3FE5